MLSPRSPPSPPSNTLNESSQVEHVRDNRGEIYAMNSCGVGVWLASNLPCSTYPQALSLQILLHTKQLLKHFDSNCCLDIGCVDPALIKAELAAHASNDNPLQRSVS